VVVTVEPVTVGRPVPPAFVGLSIETTALEAYAGRDPSAIDPVFEQLVRNLAPGQQPVLRIGGDSTDRTWWPVPGISRPPGAVYSLNNRWAGVARALADGLGARLIIGINLEADSPTLAAAEARSLIAGIGRRRIEALEIGNEPELYSSFPWYRKPDGTAVPGRPPGYDFSAFTGDFSRVAAALPPVPLAGPAIGSFSWIDDLPRFVAAEPRLAVLTFHRYALKVCAPRDSSKYPTVGNLLSDSASAGLADSVAPFLAVARARGLTVRIDELNAVASCGLPAPLSTTFAPSLWALDTLFQLARVGVDGVNIHTWPGNNHHLFTFQRVRGKWQAFVEPEYYGVLMFVQAAPPGARLLKLAGLPPGPVRAYATLAPDRRIRVVLINQDINHVRLLAVRLSGPGRVATLERLQAPSVDASTGVTLGGQSFGPETRTGLLAGPERDLVVAPTAGRYVVRLPPASAAMLTFG
jgi:Glycosyl hydrolase family 79 C-terminal beta domain